MDDDLGTADERGAKRVGARDPLHVHPLMIIQLPHSKGHGPAPEPMAMSPQQRADPAISNDLPDAPLSAQIVPLSAARAFRHAGPRNGRGRRRGRNSLVRKARNLSSTKPSR